MMNAKIKRKLEERNKRIIQAIIKKMEIICPGSVALIGIYGSFYSGDIHEKSDLDLLIIITDDRGWGLSSCFILDGIGFDIYCSKWDSLEHMAEYHDPYCGNLIDLEIVYSLDKEAEERYDQLQKKLLKKLNSSLSAEDVEKAKGFLHKAESKYVDVMINNDIAKCRSASAQLLCYLEFSLYMLNKKIVKYGIKRIPEEIKGMEILPANFLELHNQIVFAETVQEMKESCTEIIKIMRNCFQGFEKSNHEKSELSANGLRGTYEEIYSNWRNKMFYSATIDNAYLSYQTVASCQNFYDEMANDFAIKSINVIKDFSPSDLAKTAACFDIALAEYLKLYEQMNVDIISYKTIEEFEKGYLID